MRGQRVAVAVFLAAAGTAGAWVLTETPDASQTVRVDAPASQPAPPSTLVFDELLRQVKEKATSGRLCEAPPIERPEELTREVDKALASAPIPTTVRSDELPGVINVHRRLVAC